MVKLGEQLNEIRAGRGGAKGRKGGNISVAPRMTSAMKRPWQKRGWSTVSLVWCEGVKVRSNTAYSVLGRDEIEAAWAQRVQAAGRLGHSPFRHGKGGGMHMTWLQGTHRKARSLCPRYPSCGSNSACTCFLQVPHNPSNAKRLAPSPVFSAALSSRSMHPTQVAAGASQRLISLPTHHVFSTVVSWYRTQPAASYARRGCRTETEASIKINRKEKRKKRNGKKKGKTGRAEAAKRKER